MNQTAGQSAVGSAWAGVADSGGIVGDDAGVKVAVAPAAAWPASAVAESVTPTVAAVNAKAWAGVDEGLATTLPTF